MLLEMYKHSFSNSIDCYQVDLEVKKYISFHKWFHKCSNNFLRSFFKGVDMTKDS